jgi:hypothetical protein
LDRYKVGDLFVKVERVRVVLLLESPHTEEFRYKYPLAGNSGLFVARVLAEKVASFNLLDSITPLGRQLMCRGIESIGIMNCSNYPMDKRVYAAVDYVANQNKINALELIRHNPKSATRSDSECQTVENDVVASLRERLSRLPGSALIVPCGSVARNTLQKVSMSDLNIYQKRVPHPARGRWSVASNFEDAQGLFKIIGQQVALADDRSSRG